MWWVYAFIYARLRHEEIALMPLDRRALCEGSRLCNDDFSEQAAWAYIPSTIRIYLCYPYAPTIHRTTRIAYVVCPHIGCNVEHVCREENHNITHSAMQTHIMEQNSIRISAIKVFLVGSRQRLGRPQDKVIVTQFARAINRFSSSGPTGVQRPETFCVVLHTRHGD